MCNGCANLIPPFSAPFAVSPVLGLRINSHIAQNPPSVTQKALDDITNAVTGCLCLSSPCWWLHHLLGSFLMARSAGLLLDPLAPRAQPSCNCLPELILGITCRALWTPGPAENCVSFKLLQLDLSTWHLAGQIGCWFQVQNFLLSSPVVKNWDLSSHAQK